jgi:hypothetical protein
MEEEFVAAVGILLPSSKLVKDGEGNTFLERIVAFMVSAETNSEAGNLKTKGKVEVLGNV